VEHVFECGGEVEVRGGKRVVYAVLQLVCETCRHIFLLSRFLLRMSGELLADIRPREDTLWPQIRGHATIAACAARTPQPVLVKRSEACRVAFSTESAASCASSCA